VAVLGWLFVGKPARNTELVSGMTAPPQAMGAEDVPYVAGLVINRLKVSERHKDWLVRVFAAVFVAVVLVVLHLQLLGMAAK